MPARASPRPLRSSAVDNRRGLVAEELHVPAAHPDRVRPDPPRARAEVRSGAVAEAADPVHVGVAGVTTRSPARGRRTRRRPRPRSDRPACRVTSPRAASKVRDTSSSSSTPTSERRPDQSRAPPPSSQNTLSLRAKPSRTASSTGSLMQRNVPTSSAPWRDRIDSGWNCTPSSGRLAVAHGHHDTVGGRGHLELVGHCRRRERVVAHRLERRRDPGEHADPVVHDLGHLAVGRLDPADRPAVRRDEGLHPEAHAEHGHTELEDRAAEGEVGRVRRMTRPGREDDVGRRSGAVEDAGCIVLDDLRELAGDGGDEVHEVPGVGVVVIHDQHPGRGHPRSSSNKPRSSANPFSVRIDSAWNCTPRKCGPATRWMSPVAGSASTFTPGGTSSVSARPTKVL